MKLFEIEKNESQPKSKQKKVTFKEYEMNRIQLLPPSIDSLIPENHIVRVVNKIINELNLDFLIEKYEGGGTSAYHPQMLLKVIIYSYTQRTFSGREMAKQLRENINYIWLSGGNKPDFRTINRFRSVAMKNEVEKVFSEVLHLLIEYKYIKLENYFLDGTKIEANANKYTFVWKKSTEKYNKNLQVKIKELLKSIDEIGVLEDKHYNGEDYPEVTAPIIDSLKISDVSKQLNDELNNKNTTEEYNDDIDSDTLSEKLKDIKDKNNTNNKLLSKAEKTIEKDYLPRLKKYENYMEILDKRNSFSKTDTDATFMRMKEDHMKNGQLKAGYNIQIGTENQFIVGYSIHQKPGDTTCLIQHLEKTKKLLGNKMPNNIIADAGYGSEENYEYINKNKLGNYVKYNMFHKEDTKKYKNDIYKSSNFKYDKDNDTFICPTGKQMKFLYERNEKTENGYISNLRYYRCDSCENCTVKEICTKAKGDRVIQVNFNLIEQRKKVKENLWSEKGVALRKQRSVDVEPVFGMIKGNRHFKRFLLRGIEKVNIEWGIAAIAHNLMKMVAVNTKLGMI
jgi:transposase